MRWPSVTQLYGPEFRANPAFTAATEDGVKRWSTLHSRAIQHNIRVVAAYYTCITMGRLQTLLDLPAAETESYLSGLVSKGTVWAKIDRPAGIVSFKTPNSGVDDVLNVWSGQVKSVLDLIGKTGHLISKEEMINQIQR